MLPSRLPDSNHSLHTRTNQHLSHLACAFTQGQRPWPWAALPMAPRPLCTAVTPASSARGLAREPAEGAEFLGERAIA